MSKEFQFFFLFSLIINSYISQINDANKENYNLRSLEANPILNVTTKDAGDLKFHYQLSQTVYTEPFAKNYYFTTLYITENKVRQTYLIDTGSDIMSSSCKAEPGLGSTKNNFIFGQNKTFNQLKCDTKVCNMLPSCKCEKDDKNNLCTFDSSNNSTQGIKGYYIQDIAYLEEQSNIISPLLRRKYHSHAVPIGCTTDEFGKYKDLMVDGILGVNNSPKSFIGLLYELKIIKRNLFSLCFGPRGGYMSLGEIEIKHHYDRIINYVPFVESDTYYQIKVECLSLKSKDNIHTINSINNNTDYIKTDAIAQINTGYNVTYLPEAIYIQLILQFNNYCERKGGCGAPFKEYPELGYCTTFPDRESLFNSIYRGWPEIIVTLEKNLTYTWKPFNYYAYHHLNQSEERYACLGFAKHNSPNIILGTNFIHGYDIIFDREEKKLGFVKSECSRGNHLWRRSNFNRFYNGNEEEEKERVRDSIRRFPFRFNRSEDAIDFIRGTNSELNFSRRFKFINYILLFVSIIILLIVAVSVISLLIRNKKTGLKYEEPDVVIDQETENKGDEDY